MMAGRFAIAVWLLPALAAFLSAPAHAQSDESVQYRVQRGDTLIGLAEKYLRRPGDYRIVQRRNRIANPYRIPVGKRLAIPFRLLKYRPASASLTAWRGDVAIAPAARANSLAPAAGLEIGEGYILETARNSSMALQLENGSALTLPSNSRLRVARLRRILLTDSIDIEFAVEKGSARSKVAPFEKSADRYRMRTPSAVSAVRGTDFRTRVDEGRDLAFNETVEGTIGVTAEGSTASAVVPAGQGASVAANGALATATLAPPPELVDAGAVQSEEELTFRIADAGESDMHRLLVAADAGFIELVAEAVSTGPVAQLPTISNGRYFVKARTIQPSGFEGLPATYGFKRQLSTLGGEAEAGDFGYRFRWLGQGSGVRQYRLQIVPGAPDALPMVDEIHSASDNIVVSDLPPGDYFWRVGVTQFADGESLHKWTEFEKLSVSE